MAGKIYVRCAVCGRAGRVDNNRLKTTPMLAFLNPRKRERYDIDVWICDVHWSDGSLNSPSM